MTIMRRCSRTACGRRAVATLTYVYAEQTAVLGRLSTFAEPHTYDLCAEHAQGLTGPRGWQVVRLVTSFESDDRYSDDLLALAEAVNTPTPPSARVGKPAPTAAADPPGPDQPRSGQRRHLRVLPEA